ncbi:hypothetical protein EC950183_4034, partial [Escherichia coli 95.0183]
KPHLCRQAFNQGIGFC